MNIEILKTALQFLRNEDELKIIVKDRPFMQYHIVEAVSTFDELRRKRCLTLEVERTREYKHE